MNYLSLLAMAAPPATQSGDMPNPLIAYAPLFVSMFLIMYFLVIKPQKKQQSERDSMLKALKKGDKVVTNGGIIGTVIGVKENQIVLKVGDNDTKLEFILSAVSQILKEQD